LSLDRRGDWRLQGERVTHRGLIDFLNRQYAVDERGCWFVQNGPQRVFVALAYTPWIFRLDGESLVCHTGQPAGEIRAVFLDDEGSLLIETEVGLGLLDDRDLETAIGQCTTPNGSVATENDLAAALDGEPERLVWRGFPLEAMAAVDAKKRFKFVPNPAP
jgi:hypothetical protein